MAAVQQAEKEKEEEEEEEEEARERCRTGFSCRIGRLVKGRQRRALMRPAELTRSERSGHKHPEQQPPHAPTHEPTLSHTLRQEAAT